MNYASIFLGIGLALFGGYLVTQQDFTAPYGKSYTDVELIKEGEGYRACTYLDTVGIKTVCYGFNLERGDSKSRVQAAGGDWNTLNQVGGCTTQSVCDKLLQKEVDIARNGKKNIYGSKVGCSNADAVLVDLVYNNGEAGMRGFPKFNADIANHDWSQAAVDLDDSLYCRQTKTRCVRNENIIKGC